MEVDSDGFSGAGFDPTERAFVVARTGQTGTARVMVTLQASKDSPAVNPVLRVRRWNAPIPRIEIGGQPVPTGKDVRAGLIPGLEGDDLVLWVRGEWMSPVRISISSPEATTKGDVR
jgi:hypothetical protein